MFSIKKALGIGIIPITIILYFNAASTYRELPGCQIVETREHCEKRDAHLRISGTAAKHGTRAVLCALGIFSGRWGMCRKSYGDNISTI